MGQAIPRRVFPRAAVRAARRGRRARAVAGFAVAVMVASFAPASGSPTSPGFDDPVQGAFGLSPDPATTSAAPDLVDFNRDGDIDAFIGNSSGATQFFQNAGTPTSPAFTLGGSPFGSAGTRSSPDLVDIDDDGLIDAMVGNGSGDTLLFRNTGRGFASPAANPFGLTNVGTDAAPTFVDIDGDLDLDAFLGSGSGNTQFFRNTGTSAAPAFAAPQANPFGLAAVTISSSPAFADVDADGDLDALVGNGVGETVFFRNAGSASAPSFAGGVANAFGMQSVGFSSASPDLADLDDDGDLDAVVGGSVATGCTPDGGCTIQSRVWYFGNVGSQGTPVFTTPVTNPFNLISTGTNAVPAIADLDADGDLDALVGNNDGRMRFFTNTPNRGVTSFGAPTVDPFGLPDVGIDAAPVLADIDGDRDLDALVGLGVGNTMYMQNTGTASSPMFAEGIRDPFGMTDAGGSASPDLGDIDADGDLDAFVGNSDGNVLYHENTGTASAPSFAAAIINPFGLTAVGSQAAPDLVDIDRDGDLDLFVGNGAGSTLFFRNIGTEAAPAFRSPLTDPFGLASVGGRSAPDLVDIESDGDQDAFVGNAAGNIVFFANVMNRPPTDIALGGGSVRENQPVGTTVGTLSATDPDAGETFGFTLVPGTGAADNAAFAIVGAELRTAEVFDFEADPTKSIRVRVTDGSNNAIEEIFTVTINNSGEPPTDISLSASTVPENRPSGTVVGALSATDPDAGDTHSFALVPGAGDDDNAQFQIVGSQLRTATPLDFESDASRSIRVRAVDSTTFSVDEVFAITVMDLADRPTDIILSSSSVAENQPAGTVVGTLSATDQDAGDTFAFALVAGTGAGDNGSFQIVGTELRTTRPLDSEFDPSLSIRVRVTDSSTLTFDEVMMIGVSDVAEPPSDIGLSNTSVPENSAASTFVGTLSAVDPDLNDAKTFTLVSGVGDTDNARFEIAGTSLRTAVVFDFEEGSGKRIRVRVTDSANNTFEESFVINITNVPDAPTDITLTRTSIAENASAGTVVGGLGVVDQDQGDLHTFTLAPGSGDDDNAQFRIVGTELQSAAPFDFETDDSKTIRIRVTDSAGRFLEEAVVIAITDTLDAPTDIALSNASVAENLTSGTVVGTLTATDPDAGETHAFSLPPSVSTENAAFRIVGNELRTAESFNFEVDSSKTLQIRATDTTGRFLDKFFLIRINDVNETPTVILLDDASVDENAVAGASVGSLSTNDPDTSDVASFELVAGPGDDDNAAFDIATWTVRTTTTFNHEVDATKSIRVRATDSAGHTIDRTLTIAITDLPEAPTGIVLSKNSVQESRPIGTLVAELDAEDEDVSDAHGFQLLTGQLDNAAFDIRGDELRTAESFDHESDELKFVSIRTSDRTGRTFDQVLAVFVTDRHSFISVDDVIATEGKKGLKPFQFTLTRTGDLRGPVDIRVAVVNRNAKANKDYVHPFGGSTLVFTFEDHEVRKFLQVMVIGDKKKEKDECFVVELFAQEHTRVGDGLGCGRIKNDDK